MLTPYLQYTLIHKGIDTNPKPDARKKPLDYLQTGYTWLLNRCFAHPCATLATGGALVAAGAVLFVKQPQRMMPVAERNQFAVEFYLPNGTTAKRTAEVADSMAQILQRDPLVTSVTTFIGQGSPRFHTTYAPQIGGPNFAQFIVNTANNDATEKVLDKYADRYSDYFPDCYVRFKEMDYNSATYPIEIRVSGDSIGRLKQEAKKVEACMRSIEGIHLVRTNYEAPLPCVRITPDETEANRLGVNKTILSANLAIHFGDGLPMSTLWEGDYPVKMVLKSENDSDLNNEYIPVMGGTASVPLRQLAKIAPDWQDGSIVRRNGVRNGIIRIDYAEELRREKGLSVRDAAFQAGERRMRPIFLTSAAASVGVLPMMLENNTPWSPMGAVIFFGTLISMVLIATVLPILYWLVFDKHGKYSLRRKASAEHN